MFEGRILMIQGGNWIVNRKVHALDKNRLHNMHISESLFS